jgi:hypothetical protein
LYTLNWRRLAGRDQDLKLLESSAGQIQELRGARRHIDTPPTGHKGYLLLLEVQYTTNRDKLRYGNPRRAPA